MTPKKKIEIKEEPVVFQSEGNQLVGVLHTVGSPRVVVLCHGFTGNKLENKRLFVEAAREFAANGIDAFRFDFYGSGDSAGDFADTTITHNMNNLEDAVALMKEKNYRHIALLGLSMGGATAILAAGKLPVDLLITWSAVPDMKMLFENYVGDLPQELPEITSHEYNGWTINKTFWEDGITHDIQEAFAQLRLPKLIVQGTGDKELFVNGFHAFRDIALPPADFMEMPGAGHTFETPAHRRQVIRQTTIWLKRKFEQLNREESDE